tara:strand:- start:436 stop:678 length:243 start_codon:yes stop_codon:yes gene_type:complete
MEHRHPFKGLPFFKEYKINKEQLRLDIKLGTEEFLRTNKIIYLEDSPSGKVPEVYIRDLGAYSDAAEFYYLEETLNTNSN